MTWPCLTPVLRIGQESSNESMSRQPSSDLVASHELLRRGESGLDAFFAPQTVAVIGATETPGSVGRTLLWNLISSPFGGTVFPINPKRPSVLGIKAYPRIADTPMPVDLAVIATPAATVPQVIAECAAAGVQGAIIISAGFRETGPEGAELERRVRLACRSEPRQNRSSGILARCSWSEGCRNSSVASMRSVTSRWWSRQGRSLVS